MSSREEGRQGGVYLYEPEGSACAWPPFVAARHCAALACSLRQGELEQPASLARSRKDQLQQSALLTDADGAEAYRPRQATRGDTCCSRLRPARPAAAAPVAFSSARRCCSSIASAPGSSRSSTASIVAPCSAARLLPPWSSWALLSAATARSQAAARRRPIAVAKELELAYETCESRQPPHSPHKSLGRAQPPVDPAWPAASASGWLCVPTFTWIRFIPSILCAALQGLARYTCTKDGRSCSMLQSPSLNAQARASWLPQTSTDLICVDFTRWRRLREIDLTFPLKCLGGIGHCGFALAAVPFSRTVFRLHRIAVTKWGNNVGRQGKTINESGLSRQRGVISRCNAQGP